MSSSMITQSRLLTKRKLIALWRQPWFVLITLIQPMIWLLVFGALFKPVASIKGFEAESYYDFLVPGIVIMTAVFVAGWTGMGMLRDLEHGFVDRILVSPSKRIPMIIGPLGSLWASYLVQVVVIVVVGALVGAEYPGGVVGILVMAVCGSLLAASIGALSNGLALVARKEETMFGAVTMLALPSVFMSGALMQLNLAPNWIQEIARFNPVNWAVVGGREAMSASVDWSVVGVRVGGLAVLAVLCVWAGSRAFRAYQRSI